MTGKKKQIKVTPVILPALMDIPACGEFQHTLSELLANQPACIADAAPVERVSTPGIQLLYATWMTAKSANKPFELLNPSAPLLQAAEDLGLSEIFQAFTITEEVTL